MRSGGGKQKGASFERDVCRKLSLWVTYSKQEDVFWRSAMSGGRSTVAHAKGKRMAAQAGDISCIHPAGQIFADVFLIECKHYADLNYTGLLTGTGNLLAFWEELDKQCLRYEKLPFLIAKQNRLPTMVCTTRQGLSRLDIDPVDCVLTAPRRNMFLIEFEKCLTFHPCS